MTRANYASPDHRGTKIVNGGAPVLGTDFALKSTVDATDLQPRWSGSLTNLTCANGSFFAPTTWVQSANRGITFTGGSTWTVPQGVYLITFQGAFSAPLPAGKRASIYIVHNYDGTNARYYPGPVGLGESPVTVTCNIGVSTFNQFYTMVYQGIGSSMTLNGVMSIVRVSDV